MARFASEAERLRAHREAFLLAQELGCTPREAEAELARRAARKRWHQAEQRLRSAQAKSAAKGAAPAFATASIHAGERPDFWWKKD